MLYNRMAHDLNNMLHTILSNIELMRMFGPLDESQLSRAHAIEETVRQAAELTRHLTAVAGPERPEMSPVDLNSAVSSVLDLLESACDPRIILTGRLTPNLPPVRADATCLRQLLLSLCLTRLQAMQPGGQLGVATSLERATDALAEGISALKPGRQYARIQISDTDDGVAAAMSEGVLAPLSLIGRHEGGTDLITAVAHSIVAALDGAIAVQGAPGCGMTLTAYLPLAETGSYGLVQPLPACEGGAEIILLVEDNQDIRDNLRQLLASLGYTVVEADGGTAAVDIFGRSGDQVDLVVVDMDMPDMPGTKAFEQMRRHRPDARGLLMTGFLLDPDQLHKLPAGISTVLHKPFSGLELARCVRSALAGGSMADVLE